MRLLLKREKVYKYFLNDCSLKSRQISYLSIKKSIKIKKLIVNLLTVANISVNVVYLPSEKWQVSSYYINLKLRKLKLIFFTYLVAWMVIHIMISGVIRAMTKCFTYLENQILS